MGNKIEVAIGILTDDKGRLLVGKRMRDPQAGKWEMPGGKVEAGETVEAALRREFREEGDIELDALAHWTKIESDSHILHLFKVHASGEFIPTIYQEFRYVEADEIMRLEWIATNLDFIQDLEIILKASPIVETMTFFPKTSEELSEDLDKITLEYHARDRFSSIVCFLDYATNTLIMNADIESKVDMLYHEGVKFYAIGNPTLAISDSIQSFEGGHP